MNISTFFYNLADYLVLLPAAIMCFAPVSGDLRFKKRWLLPLIYVCLTLVCGLGAVAETCITTHNPNTLFFPIMGISIVVYLVLVRQPIYKLLYIFLMVSAALSFGGLSSYLLEAHLHPTGFSSDPQTWGLLLQWIIDLAIMTLYLSVFRKKLQWILFNFSSAKTWLINCICPLVILICEILMIPENYSLATSGRAMKLYIILQIAFFVIYITSMIMFYSISHVIVERNEAEHQSLVMGVQAKQYDALASYIEQDRKHRYDHRHTMATIYNLVQNKDFDALAIYMEEMNQHMSHSSARVFCTDLALNAILNYYAEQASENNIPTNWKINLPADNTINSTDLCTIMSNLLDNAVIACLEIPEEKRFINLSADMDIPGSIYIVSNNSFNGKITKKGNRFLSTHKNGTGLGIPSILSLSEKYEGAAQFYAKNDVFFTAIMLKLPKSSE